MTPQDKAIKWFESKGINAYAHEELVYIVVNDYHILISTSEIEYRAELLDEEA